LGETERAWAVTYASISGTPYDVHGADSTTVPFPALDPLPHFELSVNGMAPQRVVFDTGATLGLTKETAQHAGLVGLATSHTFAAGQQLTLTHGVADSIRIGQVELRNVPLTWPDQIWFPELPDGTLPAGVVGTDIFYFRPDLFAFEVIGAFAHDFYKPFAVTFDFVDMNLYITEALMSGSTAWLPGHRGGRCVVRCAAVG
jgi:Aspartyl protease